MRDEVLIPGNAAKVMAKRNEKSININKVLPASTVMSLSAHSSVKTVKSPILLPCQVT